MLLLFDIGNTNTHVGLANNRKVIRQTNLPTKDWQTGRAAKAVSNFVRTATIEGIALCSVVPKITPLVAAFSEKRFKIEPLELTADTAVVGIDYPKPHTIGPDRLANSIAVAHNVGVPAIVVDFGTAVTFDVVNKNGDYVGGIIAPGLNVMTDYLHDKTALLPKIKIRETKAVIGKNTEEAMLIGAVHGYRGLIRALIAELKQQLKASKLPVVATGGYAELISAKVPEITKVDPLLTLEGLRLLWETHANCPCCSHGGGEPPCALREGDI
jgi:type III pantothenate kinase